MRRFIALVVITDDGITGEANQEQPVYLLTKPSEVRKLLEKVPYNTGINVTVKFVEEAIP